MIKYNHNDKVDLKGSINSDIVNDNNYRDKSEFPRYNFFYDIYISRFRLALFAIMMIALILVFSPLYVYRVDQFGFENTIFYDNTMKAKEIEISQYSMVSIMVPLLVDTMLDLTGQTFNSFEIHERIMFIIITVIHPIINILYFGTLKGAIGYIFVNQASVIVAVVCVFSCLSKLEKLQALEMISILVGLILVSLGGILKMYGFINEEVMNPGIVIATIGNLLNLANCCFGILKTLNLTSCIASCNFDWQKHQIIVLSDAEETSILYMAIFVVWIIAVIISNTTTNSISWKSSSIANILSFEIFQICLVFAIVALPMRLSRKRQKTAITAIAELTERNMILTQVLPNEAVQAIQKGIKVKPKTFQSCTIFFSDIEGFTDLASKIDHKEVMYILDELYSVMDYVTATFKKRELLKVETIGDSYMLVSGVQDLAVDHCTCITDYALIVRRVVTLVLNPITKKPLNIRIGIHSGSVSAGVVGFLTPRWSLFGDTVNTASRMETNSLPGKINASEDIANFIMKHERYQLTKREKLEVKGKGLMQTYFVDENKESTYFDTIQFKKIEEECKLLIQKCKSSRCEADSISSIIANG